MSEANDLLRERAVLCAELSVVQEELQSTRVQIRSTHESDELMRVRQELCKTRQENLHLQFEISESNAEKERRQTVDRWKTHLLDTLRSELAEAHTELSQSEFWGANTKEFSQLFATGSGLVHLTGGAKFEEESYLKAQLEEKNEMADLRRELS